MNKTLATLITLLLGTTLFAANIPDSVRIAGAEEFRIEKGLNFDITFGAGFGRFEFGQIGSGFKPEHTTNALASPTWNAGVGINYYFLPWMGVGTGVQFSTYANRTSINKAWVVTDKDYQGDDYTLTATPQNLSERQSIYMIEVPLALRFRAIKSKVGFHGVAGLKLGFPIYDHYRLNQGGSFHNEVQYAQWDLTLNNIPGMIEDFNVPSVSNNFASKLRTVNYAAYSEIGMLIRLQQRLDLMLAVTATYYFNDILSGKSTTQPLGFDQHYKAGTYTSPFEADYDGVLGSGEVQELHPWSVAVKIGLSINAGKTKAQRDYEKRKQVSEFIEQCGMNTSGASRVIHDTLYIHIQDTLRDTIAFVQIVPAAPMQLEEAMQTAVMWFGLNDTTPMLEPEDFLVRIADNLIRHPEQRVQINGHACKLGKPAYNQRLALRRAQAVANRLIELGVKPEQLIVQGMGSDVPYDNDGEHQLDKDRRVEIVPQQ